MDSDLRYVVSKTRKTLSAQKITTYVRNKVSSFLVHQDSKRKRETRKMVERKVFCDKNKEIMTVDVYKRQAICEPYGIQGRSCGQHYASTAHFN